MWTVRLGLTRNMEAVWALVLAASFRDRRVRLLAGLLAAKWAVSYAGFLYVGEWAPVFTDAVAATLCVCCLTCAPIRRSYVSALFILTLLVHGAYWLTGEVGLWWPVAYYYALILLYTLQVLTLLPWERVRVRRLVRSRRRSMARRPVFSHRVSRTQDQIAP